MKVLSYNDALELLGYADEKRHPLEILGYDYSTLGKQQFDSDRTDIEPLLNEIICNDLNETGVFPKQFHQSRPDCGVFVEQSVEGYTLVERDKPYLESRWIYESQQAAARALVFRRCDHSLLKGPLKNDDFILLKRSW